MSSRSSSGAAILQRLIAPEEGDLSREVAQAWLKLDFSPFDHSRLSQLSRKAQNGSATDKDRKNLDEYLRVADFLAIIQSKARQALKRRRSSSWCRS